MHITPELTALIAKHMDHLEAQLKLEREYPEWSAEGERKFEALDFRMVAIVRAIADEMAAVHQAERFKCLQVQRKIDENKRNTEFDDWCNNMAREHDQHMALVDHA